MPERSGGDRHGGSAPGSTNLAARQPLYASAMIPARERHVALGAGALLAMDAAAERRRRNTAARCDPPKHVHDAGLGHQRLDHPPGYRLASQRRFAPGIQRRGPVQGQKCHQQARQTDPVVVVQVGGLVDELGIGEVMRGVYVDIVYPSPGREPADRNKNPATRNSEQSRAE